MVLGEVGEHGPGEVAADHPLLGISLERERVES
jgi:hypothetical protein